jgi:hypothetical protein
LAITSWAASKADNNYAYCAFTILAATAINYTNNMNHVFVAPPPPVLEHFLRVYF